MCFSIEKGGRLFIDFMFLTKKVLLRCYQKMNGKLNQIIRFRGKLRNKNEKEVVS